MNSPHAMELPLLSCECSSSINDFYIPGRCDRPSNPRYGYITSTPRSRSTYSQGDHITYGCNPGYCL